MKQGAPRSPELPSAAKMLAQYAAKKPKRTKAERQAAMADRIAAPKAVAGSPETATVISAPAVPAPTPLVTPPTAATADVAPFQPPPPAQRPLPAEGDVWSCASLRNGGRRYIRLVKINRRSTAETPYADAVEILADGTRRFDTILQRECMRTSLEPDGRMPPVYSYEPTITKETETLDLSTSRAAASGAEETPMSTPHTETVHTPATVPPMKKAALTAMAKATEKKLAATEKKLAAPKAVKVAKPAKAAAPKAEKKAARSYTVPAPGTIIHKTFKGKELEPIKALAEGRFSYKGKTYETIHELGSHIRGGKPTWAYEFFGLTK